MNPADFARTCPSAKLVCMDAVLFGYRLVFNGRSLRRGGGVANIESGRGTVHGVLWDVPESEVPALDRREGAPFVYARFPVKVRVNRDWVHAQTYQLVRPLDDEIAPSPEYAQLMLDGIANPGYRKSVMAHIDALIAREERMRNVGSLATDSGRDV
jgi:gamma-glutamylcyclotransferase (GGCT)/AIG2-like uncharacterized protein YtfP